MMSSSTLNGIEPYPFVPNEEIDIPSLFGIFLENQIKSFKNIILNMF